MSLNIHYTDETEYYVAFSHVSGIGPLTVKKLIKKFGSIQSAYNAPVEQLAQLIPAEILKNLLEFRSQQSPYSLLKSLLKKDIQVLTPELPQYPEKIRNIAVKPLCLYIKGNLSIITDESTPAIAVVGSRYCTPYGRYLTNAFTSRLASAGMTIISGMAIGIDALAHEAALKFKTGTLAILGCGVEVIYPPANTRNRLISAFSDGVLIIEGTNKSGTLITAKHAGDQGRSIFLPPYNLNATYGYTFSHLMQNGGVFVFSPDDIFEHLNLKPPPLPPDMTLTLSEDEIQLMALIRQEIANPDSIAEELSIPMSTILNRLLELEIKGHIAKDTLGEYYIC